MLVAVRATSLHRVLQMQTKLGKTKEQSASVRKEI